MYVVCNINIGYFNSVDLASMAYLFHITTIFFNLQLQVRLVPFQVIALVTVSDLEFSVECIDFGTCTIHESVIVTIKLSNKSVLPQKFSFIELPEVIWMM